MITSTANQQVKHLIQLQNKAKLRDEEGVFVLEGKKVYDELRKYRPQFLVMTYLSESFYKQIAETEPEYLEGISYEILADNVFKEAAETVTPQGVLAIVKQPKYELEELLRKNAERSPQYIEGSEKRAEEGLDDTESPLRFRQGPPHSPPLKVSARLKYAFLHPYETKAPSFQLPCQNHISFHIHLLV